MAEREQREAILTEICTQLNASAVQHIGKILVVYLANPDIHKIEIKQMPVARALIGKSSGDIAEVKTPLGVREYEVVEVQYL